jgi:hypothetical protein
VADQGRVYVCAWEETDSGFRIWVRNRPSLAGTGPTFEDAANELSSTITDKTGDGENVHEYVPPAPTNRSGRGVQASFAHAGLEARTHVLNPEELFSEPHCPACRSTRGERTDAVAKIGSIKTGVDGVAAYTMPRAPRGRSTLQLFSEAFLELLTDSERTLCSWRPVARSARANTRFFEIVAAPPAIPQVALRGEPQSERWWRCDVCGAEGAAWYSDPNGMVAFVPYAGAVRESSCFLFGNAPEYGFCFSTARWVALSGAKGTRGMKSFRVFAVEPSRAEPVPRTRVATMERPLWRPSGTPAETQ